MDLYLFDDGRIQSGFRMFKPVQLACFSEYFKSRINNRLTSILIFLLLYIRTSIITLFVTLMTHETFFLVS